MFPPIYISISSKKNYQMVIQMKRYKFIPILILIFLLGPIFINKLSQNSLAEVKEKEIITQGGIYRRPVEFIPGKLDPAFSTDIYGVMIIQQIFDGLVQFDKDLNIIPGIAKSWKISPDGLTYTFYLREGIKFHNGREVTADDFVYSFTRIIDPKNKAPAAHLLEKVLGFKEFQDGKTNYVKGLKFVDKFIFEIKLSELFYPFISTLGINHFKVIPREEIEKPTPDFTKFPIGTGPFKFVSMKEGEEIVLVANPDYFEGRPYLDKIVFKIFHGALREKILKEFKEGNLDESFISPGELEHMGKDKRYIFLQKPILSLRFYGLNLSSKPLGDKRLRKAINFVIDKKFIVGELHKNQFNLARGILPPGMPGYDPMRNPYPFDETKAKKLLSEAGYIRGKSVPTLEVWSASRSEAAQKELSEIQSQFWNSDIRIEKK